MLTIKGIYGREMYETWYKMTVMLQAGLDISPVITHRFHYTRIRGGASTPCDRGQAGKVHPELDEGTIRDRSTHADRARRASSRQIREAGHCSRPSA